jgi:hypothetical protein
MNSNTFFAGTMGRRKKGRRRFWYVRVGIVASPSDDIWTVPLMYRRKRFIEKSFYINVSIIICTSEISRMHVVIRNVIIL